jgi:hypothetical protein
MMMMMMMMVMMMLIVVGILMMLLLMPLTMVMTVVVVVVVMAMLERALMVEMLTTITGRRDGHISVTRAMVMQICKGMMMPLRMLPLMGSQEKGG